MLSPIPHSPLSLFLLLDLLVTVVRAEIREETQLQSVTGTYQAPGPRDEDTRTYESSLIISGDRFPLATENVQTEIPTTEGMSFLLNSKAKDSMSSMMFSGSSEEIEGERVAAESSWPHRFASVIASATGSTPSPLVLETTLIEGTVY